jgi:hypothetical protein
MSLADLSQLRTQIWQTFGNGDDNDGDGDNENVDKGNTLLAGSTNGLIGTELHKEADHEGTEEDETGGSSELGDKLSERIQLELERGVLSVATHG